MAGTALWLSRAVLDVVGTAAAQERVAALGSWAELAGTTMLMVLVAGAVSLLLQHPARRSSSGRLLTFQPAVADALRPLFALGVLALPYLPWLPDRLPVLRVLAGPLKWLLWAVVLAQVGWNLLPHLRNRWWPTAAPMTGRRAVALVFLVSLGVYVFTWHQMVGIGRVPGGDEPHYLVIVQSLLDDHDLRIENNHTREDYREYYPRPLRPHYRAPGTDGEIYSIHPVGLPFLAAPAFAVAGYPGVVWLLMLLSAGTAALMWRWAYALSGSPGAATFGWAAVALSATWVLSSVTVYPEIAGAFCMMLALPALRPRPDQEGRDERLVPLVLAGLAIAALPWLHTKYAGMALVLAALLAWQHRRPGQLAALLTPVTLSLTGWFAFFYAIWGSPLPSAPYGADTQMHPLTLIRGGPGIWFDQEFGVLAYAPVLLLAFVGLATLWRGRTTRAFAVQLALVGLALVGTVGSFDLWWGGSSMPGRGIVSMLPLLVAPVAWQYQRARAHGGRRAAMQLLLLVSLAVTVTMDLAAGGRLAGQARDGTSALLEWLSPAWDLWRSAPTYIVGRLLTAEFLTLLWLTGVAVFLWLNRRPLAGAPGRAALRATATATLVALVVASVARALPAPEQQPVFDPEARSAVPFLADFDATARPMAVRYDPFSVEAPESLPPRFLLVARPGQRLDPQPRPVLLNARFALPAGEYEVELTSADGPGALAGAALSLQVGREGRPLKTWAAPASLSRPWRERFTLPIDAEFVGFLAPADVETEIAALRLRPVSVVDVGRRWLAPSVFSAGAWHERTVFFHDSAVYAERDGFWVRGWSRLRGTVVRAAGATGGLSLRVHPGPVANTATFATRYWSETVSLEPGVTRTIDVPVSPDSRYLPLSISATSGFVPADTVADSRDRRRLGVWVEILP